MDQTMEMEVFGKMRCDTWQEREARFNELVKMYAEAKKEETEKYAEKLMAVTKSERVFAEKEYAIAKSRLQTLEDVFEVLEIMGEVQDKYYSINDDEEFG